MKSRLLVLVLVLFLPATLFGQQEDDALPRKSGRSGNEVSTACVSRWVKANLNRNNNVFDPSADGSDYDPDQIFEAKQEEDWPSLSYLRSDFRDVSVVVYVRVRQAEVVNRIGGYEDWHLVGEVIESFKGKFRKGAEIEFYHGAEKGFRQGLFLGDKIVFLERNFVEKEKRWVLAVLENSTLAYTPDRVAKLRRIRSAARKHSKPRRANHSRSPYYTHRAL